VSFVYSKVVKENFAKIVQVIVLRTKDVVLAGSLRWPESMLPQSVEKVLQFITMAADP
jgi:hypothetical protein